MTPDSHAADPPAGLDAEAFCREIACKLLLRESLIIHANTDGMLNSTEEAIVADFAARLRPHLRAGAADDVERIRSALTLELSRAEGVVDAYFGMARTVSNDEACRQLRTIVKAVRATLEAPQ